MTALRNHLRRRRRESGLSQQKLADLAGISRQAYAALESGKASPSTEVALRLARALDTKVDLLFFLEEGPSETVRADLIGPGEETEHAGPQRPRRARLFHVGRRLLARPLSGAAAARHSLVDADGVILPEVGAGNQVVIQPFDGDELKTPVLALLGCDPAAAMLEPGLRRYGVRLVWTEEGSYQALTGLARGEAHVAGCHLKDEDTGEYNEVWARRVVPFPCTLVTFAAWQQGLVIAAGNPKGIGSIQHLTAPGVRIVNRPAGSGSRSLLDRLLDGHGISSGAVAGYGDEAAGHLTMARAVASGLADAGVGVQAAAAAFGLEFLPLEAERYDLVIPNHFLDEPGVQTLLDLLRRPGLQRRVEALGGYDASNMGAPVPAP